MAKPTAFEGPIPGQSLTTEPKNVPWEQPPQYADPMDALEMYMKKLADPDALDDVVDMLEVGIPISIITTSMLSQGVMDGLHSVDVKLLLKGALATQIQTLADVVGVDYKISMADYGDAEALKAQKLQSKLEAKLAIKGVAESEDPGIAIKQDVLAYLEGGEPSMEEITEESAMIEEPTEEVIQESAPAKAMGIMAKGV